MKTKPKFENGTSLNGLGLKTLTPHKSHLSSLIILSLISYLSFLVVGCKDEIVTKEVPVDIYVTGKAISSAEELAKIGVDPDYSSTGDYFLTADIDLSDYTEWTPIGSEERPFIGTFNGTNKTIKNFAITGAVDEYSGFFGYVLTSEIKNLTIEVSNSIDTPLTLPEQYNYCGFLAAFVSVSQIENITVKPARGITDPGLSVELSSVAYIGGITGYSDKSEITDSNSSIAIQCNSNSKTASVHIGGIAGSMTVNSGIANCVVSGSIEAQGKTIYAGGVLGDYPGQSTAALKDCKSSVSKVSIESSESSESSISDREACAGGIVGDGTGLDNCVLLSPAIIYAKFTATGDGVVYAGGIAGKGGGTNLSVQAAAQITAESTDGTPSLCAGGIGGYGGGTKCYVPDVGVKVTVKRAGASKVAGGYTAVGGIGGFGTATDSYSYAEVELDNSAQITPSPSNSDKGYEPAAGGLVGNYNLNETVIRSYSKGKVTVKNTNEDTTIYAGGLAGYTCGSVKSSIALNDSVVVTTECPTTQDTVHRVNGKSDSTGQYAAWAKGGDPCFVTVNGEPIKPVNNSSGADGDNSDNMPEGLTEDFLANEIGGGGEEYTWDFDTVWKWDNALNLPVLRDER